MANKKSLKERLEDIKDSVAFTVGDSPADAKRKAQEKVKKQQEARKKKRGKTKRVRRKPKHV